MGLQTAAIYIGAGSYSTPVEADRNFVKTMFGRRSGLFRPGDFKVTPTGTARQVSVSSGVMAMMGVENSTQGGYMVWSDGADLYTFAAAVGNPRIDTLVGRVVDTQYGADAGGSNAYIEIVQGVAGASPAARADSYFNSGGGAYRPGAWWRVADVRINVVDGVLPPGQITEQLGYVRQAGRTVCLSTTRPADAVIGDWVYETDTGWERVYNGTNWCIRPGTLIKYASRNTDKSTTGGTETGYLRLDGIEVVAGQAIRIATSPLRINPASGDTGIVNLHYSTTGSAAITDPVLAAAEANPSSSFNPVESMTIEWRYTAAVNQTLSVHMSLGRTGGSSNVNLNAAAAKPHEIYVYAAGPALTNTGVST